MKTILNALSLKPDAREAEVVSAVLGLVELQREVLQLSGQPTIPEALHALRDAADKASRVDSLCDSLRELHARARQAEAIALIKAATTPDAQGRVRVPPAQRRWAETYAARDPAGFREYLTVAPLLRMGATEQTSREDLRGGLRWETTPFLALARLKVSNPVQYEAVRRDFEERRRTRRNVFTGRSGMDSRGSGLRTFDGPKDEARDAGGQWTDGGGGDARGAPDGGAPDSGGAPDAGESTTVPWSPAAPEPSLLVQPGPPPKLFFPSDNDIPQSYRPVEDIPDVPVSRFTAALPPEAKPYAGDILALARTYGVNPFVLAGIVGRESAFGTSPLLKPRGPAGKGRTGDLGLAQINPGTWSNIRRRLGFKKEDWKDPRKNLEASAGLLQEDVHRYHGDYQKALADYNAGYKNVRKLRPGESPDDVTKDHDYVHDVLGKASAYKQNADLLKASGR